MRISKVFNNFKEQRMYGMKNLTNYLLLFFAILSILPTQAQNIANEQLMVSDQNRSRTSSSQIYLEDYCNNLNNWQNRSSGNAFVTVNPPGQFNLFDSDGGDWKQADILYDDGTIKDYFRVTFTAKFDQLCSSIEIDTMDGSPIDGTAVWDGQVVSKVGAEVAIGTASRRHPILFLKDEIWFVSEGFVFNRVWSGVLDTAFHDWEFVFNRIGISSFATVYRDGIELLQNSLIGYTEYNTPGWVQIIAKGDPAEPVEWHLDFIILEHQDSTITNIGAGSYEIPADFLLMQNYPNPFNPETTIHYKIPKTSHVRMSIYNILGQELKVLVNEKQMSGEKSVIWNGRDNSGKEVSSGVYIYRFQTENHTYSRKMVLLR